ncbi:hypothetical protein [Paracidovorax valerianellae]|uniref:hypothetical protein n=1 Tax=Paracidovorax valerianellae TaxID=187868 RepID=UPI0011146902|nr:hypothetical protein [Paracidovorax valerianellae]MDA8447255.1 hypothetical protein [Paracidovorax valerianellae]
MKINRKAEEIISTCADLGIDAKAIDASSFEIVKQVIFAKFRPEKTSNHYSIGGDSDVLIAEDHEFSFSNSFPSIEGFIFFGEDNYEGAIFLKDISLLSFVMNNCYGMEYFVSDENATFLVSVNWYVINLQGEAKNWVLK